MDHELKKKLTAMRNRKLMVIRQHQLLHDQSTQVAQAAAEASLEIVTARPGNEVDDVVFSAKMQDIRNKLTGKKRMAKDRWNRFAGTAAAGGKGL